DRPEARPQRQRGPRGPLIRICRVELEHVWRFSRDRRPAAQPGAGVARPQERAGGERLADGDGEPVVAGPAVERAGELLVHVPEPADQVAEDLPVRPDRELVLDQARGDAERSRVEKAPVEAVDAPAARAGEVPGEAE